MMKKVPELFGSMVFNNDEMKKMVKDGKKSIGLKMFEDKSYNIIA